MKKKIKKTTWVPEEYYQVKLWYTNEDGYLRQATIEVTVNTTSKAAHKQAEAIALDMYKGKSPEIIRVTYQ